MLLQVHIEKKLMSRGNLFTLKMEFFSQDHCVVLFGPSGSGKTLTLQSIAGMVKPDRGRIVLKDRVFFDASQKVNVPSRHRGIGYLFQDYALFPHLTVFDNVAFGLKRRWFRGLSREDRSWVENLLDTFEMLPLAGRFPRGLSGGQKQRVALARALAPRPECLLLDEPFSALDTLLRDKLRKELVHIRSTLNIPVIMVTHDPEDIHMFAETLVSCESGKVQSVQHSLKAKATPDSLSTVSSSNSR